MKHILIVDDEAPIREILSQMLTQSGFRVTEAASAHEALSRAYAALGDFDAARDERNVAYRMALDLDDEDRDVIEHDLGTIPIPHG